MKDWNYSGNPASNDRDQVRFLIGDTCKEDPLVSDKEIAFAISEQTSLKLAAAMCLRALAAVHSRMVTKKIGDISVNCSDLAKQFKARADELDPFNVATAAPLLALPVFGGLSITEKETLDDDDDAVQPSFRKGMNDIPGGPGNLSDVDYDEKLRR